VRTEREKPVVLIVDDESEIISFAATFFSDLNYKVISATTVAGAIRTIHNEANHTIVAFVDIRLQQGPSGLELLKYIKKTAAHRVVPYVFSGSSSRTIYQESMRAGAYGVYHKTGSPDDWDLLAPLVNPEESAVLNMVSSSSEEDLTGLYNYRHFRKLAEELFRSCRDRSNPAVISLLLGDVDHFKAINETHGYQEGDRALQSVARVLREQIRPSDPICRRGDEFLILLPTATDATALSRGELLQQAVGKARMRTGDGVALSLSLSIGAGTITCADIGAGDEGARHAFSVLYDRADLGDHGLKQRRMVAGHVSGAR
jgi:diguanylate cyclase (GGDEF)-like protein